VPIIRKNKHFQLFIFKEQMPDLSWQGNVKVRGMCIFFLIMPSHIVWISGRFKMVYIDGAYDSKG